MYNNEDHDVHVVISIVDRDGQLIKNQVPLQRKFAPGYFTSQAEPQAGDKLNIHKIKLTVVDREQDICSVTTHVLVLNCQYILIMPGPGDKQQVIDAVIDSELARLKAAGFKPILDS